MTRAYPAETCGVNRRLCFSSVAKRLGCFYGVWVNVHTRRKLAGSIGSGSSCSGLRVSNVIPLSLGISGGIRSREPVTRVAALPLPLIVVFSVVTQV